MLQEDLMVKDTLADLNGNLRDYGEIIAKTENLQLRQTLIQLRNSCETTQYELLLLAKEYGYYIAVEEALWEDIERVKSIFQA